MEPLRRQQWGLLLHAALLGLPHALAAFVVVGLCVRDVLPPAAALLLMVGLPLFSCAAHLLWLRWRVR